MMSNKNENQIQNILRVDAQGKVTGEAPYPGDVTPENLLHARVLFSGKPHARMLAMDTSKALAFPGVVAIAVGAGLTFVGELSIMFSN